MRNDFSDVSEAASTSAAISELTSTTSKEKTRFLFNSVFIRTLNLTEKHNNSEKGFLQFLSER
jgi:hypothetical protein